MAGKRPGIDLLACLMAAVVAVLIPVVGLALVVSLTTVSNDPSWSDYLVPFGIFVTIFVGLVGITSLVILNALGRLRPFPVIAIGVLVPILLNIRLLSKNADYCIGLLAAGTITTNCAAGGYILLLAGGISAASGYFSYRYLERRPADRPA